MVEVASIDRAVEKLYDECKKECYQKVGVRLRNDGAINQTFLWETKATCHTDVLPFEEWDRTQWKSFIQAGVDFYNAVSDFIMNRVHSVVLTIENDKEIEIIL